MAASAAPGLRPNRSRRRSPAHNRRPRFRGGGIGGTGAVADRGIGGTGIVGTITGFASVLVNGLEVDFAPDQAVSLKGEGVDPGALRVGQVVEIEATGAGQRLVARSINVRHEVVGEITRVDAGNQEIEVLGQRVRVTPETFRGFGTRPEAGALAGLGVGQTVDISGLRDERGVVHASRIDPAVRGDADRVIGRITAVDDRGFNVGGLRVELPTAVCGSNKCGGGGFRSRDS